MQPKFKQGTSVTISKVFSRESHGKFIKCKPKVAKILDARYTPTYGYAYTLEVEGKVFDVCYWESDIDGPA